MYIHVKFTFFLQIQVTLALSPKEVKIVKCNGNSQQRIMKKHDVYALSSDCLSQSIVVIGVCSRSYMFFSDRYDICVFLNNCLSRIYIIYNLS